MLRSRLVDACLLLACAASAACGSDNNTKIEDSGADALAADGGADAGADDAATGDAATEGAPPEVRDHAGDWPTANHDYAGTRAAKGARIDASNVATLTEAWRFELPSGGLFGAATAEPIVVGDTVYYIDMQNNVFALDLATGAQRWSQEYGTSTSGPNGIAVGWGKLFVTSSERSVSALSADDGHELWTAAIEVPENGGIDIAPSAYDGLVYVSTVPVNATTGYQGNVAGTLYAVDQATGKVVWSFSTIEDAGLWDDPSTNSGGGAWYPPTIDEATGRMFWGTGNPGPYPGIDGAPNGSSRPGDNLYTCSVVALDHASGELAWHYQDRKHDLFDLDFQNSPILAELEIAGKMRAIAIGSGKTGTVAALDRETGELLWRTPVGKHQNDELSEVPEGGVEVLPGDLGGIETPPAYADGVVYLPIVNWSRFYVPTGSGDQGTDPKGEVTALDAATGDVLWTKELPAPSFGGAVVSNDLVFTSTFPDGVIYALDRKTGDIVYSYTAPLGINAPLVVTGSTLLVAAGTGVGVPSLLALRLP